jgi:hypothetical protein
VRWLLRGVGRLLLALLLSLTLGAVLAGAALPVVAGGGLAVKDRFDDYLVLPPTSRCSHSPSAAGCSPPTAR